MLTFIRNPLVETYRGEAGPCGVEVHTRRRDGGKLDKGLGLIAINLRGGLGDAGSASFEGFAEELYEAGEGKFVVSTIGTNYPKMQVVKLALGLRGAREARSKTAYRGIKYVNQRYQPDIAVHLGQSQGGITVVDATQHWMRMVIKRPAGSMHIPRETGVITLDSPLKHEEAPTDPSVPNALMQLGANCAPDVAALSPSQRLAFMAAEVRHRPSVWDLAYMVAETGYLSRSYDLEPVAEELTEADISLYHALHDEDIVEHTATPYGISHTFRGGHMRFLSEPMPVVEYVREIALDLESGITSAYRRSLPQEALIQ